VDRQATFSYTRTALFVDGSYSYQVQACNSAGCGPWSVVKTATVALGSGGGGGVGGIRYAVRATSTTQTASTNESGGTAALVVQTSYTASGYPETLTRESDGYVYQHIAATDKWGEATLVYEGSSQASTAAVVITRVDDPSTGLLTSLTAENPQTNATLAQVTSSWDGFGNLTSRKAGGSTETATYDKLNRLIGSVTTLRGGGGSVTRSYSYDSTGNRTQACDDMNCTGFSYDGTGIGTNGAGPHAVTAVTLPGGTVHGSSYYAYNAMGEMTKDNDRTLTWNAFGKAESISQRQTTVNFSYGPGGSRYRKVVTGPASETVTYLGGAEVLDVGGNTSIRRTLGLAGLSVIDTGGANAGVHFGIPDHLGSMMALIDSSGSVTQGLSYGDFGKRYTTGWGGVLSHSQGWTVNTTLTDKGYTGQESLDSVGLDDYNARLYDPGLGRFLSTDPLISHPGSTQSINPYSYVDNNPLNKTDPTGQAAMPGCEMANCVVTKSVIIPGVGSIGAGAAGSKGAKNDQPASSGGSAQKHQAPASSGTKTGDKNPNSTNGNNVNKHNIKGKQPTSGGKSLPSKPYSKSIQNQAQKDLSNIKGELYGENTAGTTKQFEAMLSVILNRVKSGERQYVNKGSKVTVKNVLDHKQAFQARNSSSARYFRAGKASPVEVLRVNTAVKDVLSNGPTTNATFFISKEDNLAPSAHQTKELGNVAPASPKNIGGLYLYLPKSPGS